MIENSDLSEGNKDSPEAGLDALMQVFCSYMMRSVWENELAVLGFEPLEKFLKSFSSYSSAVIPTTQLAGGRM